MQKILKIYFCFHLFCNVIQSQNLRFHHYGLEEGLSQETILCILKDSNGFLWLGTQDGLNRFDGNQFKVYRHKKRDSLSITGNFIQSLVEDNNKNIWIGTNDNGIVVYNSSKDIFKKTNVNYGNCTGLAKDKFGNIYTTILNQGLYFFDASSKTYSLKNNPIINNETLQLTACFIKDDLLYIGSKTGRLFISKIDNKKKLEFTEIPLDITIGEIKTINTDKNHIWLGTTNGVFFINKISKQITAINLDNTYNVLEIESIKIHDNTYYFSTYYGLYIGTKYNINKHSFENLKIYNGLEKHSNTITSNRVYTTFLDDNLLWIGTNNLDVVSIKAPVFNIINTTSQTPLNNNFVLSVTQHANYTFVGTRNGITCIDKNGNVNYITQKNTQNKLAYDIIRHLKVDHNENLWVATIKGVSVIDLKNFDPKKPKIKSFFNNPKDSFSIGVSNTRSIYEDHNNTIWIATYGGGLNRFIGNIETNDFKFIRYINERNKNTISSNYVYNISQDSHLNYWITSETGLNKLTFKDSTYQSPIFSNFYHIEKDSTSLNSNTTLHTYQDINNIIWVASQNGFHKYNHKTNKFKYYGEEHGLTNSFIYSITPDKQNNLWLTTNGGIFKFNKTTEKFINYNIGDGLQSTEFNLGAHFYDNENNIIYAGGINGLNKFNPDKVSELDNEGTLKFTSLQIKNTEINPVTHPKIIEENITQTKSIHLNYNDFPCYLTVSELDLRPTKNNNFVYKLNNNEWAPLKGNEVQLLNLNNGKHTLQVQGKSRLDTWKKTPLEITIEVKAPWYKSNLAYLLYLLTFTILIYTYYKINVKRKLAAQESFRLKELDSLKSRFITNITHEFRTPLTIISGYVSQLKDQFKTNNEATESLHKVEKNNTDLFELVTQMLDLAKLEQGKLDINYIQGNIVKYIEIILSKFNDVAEHQQIDLNYVDKNKEIITDFDAEKLRQILSNLISNAIKFSKKNTTVTITTRLKNKHIVIEVKDQGIGIPKADLNNIFDRFYQVESNHNKVSRGTGIGLALTKELTELLKGSISVNSSVQEGTNFIVKLPVTNTAVLEDFSTLNIEKKLANTAQILKEHKTPSTNYTILIVEDYEEMAQYIASCLDHSYNIIIANNGNEGLQQAKKHIPDIIISDVMMPVMDGFELTQKLQSNSNTDHIPIIMLTSKAMQEDKMEGITSGVDIYLTKPFEKEELRLRIQMLILKREKLQKRYAVNAVVKQKEDQPKPKDKNLIFLNSVIDAIHNHLNNSDFGATELAKFLAMSDSQLYRKLKAISNTSTAVFIRKVRLEKGKKMLKNTDLSISEIAYATGFNDPNWFSKTFKDEFKQSPTEFRN